MSQGPESQEYWRKKNQADEQQRERAKALGARHGALAGLTATEAREYFPKPRTDWNAVAFWFAVAAVFIASAGVGMAWYRAGFERDLSQQSLCRAMQLRTCNDETLRQAFAAGDYRVSELEHDVAVLEDRITAAETLATAEGHFKAEPAKGAK